MNRLLALTIVLGCCVASSVSAGENNKDVSDVSVQTITLPGGLVRFPLNYFFPPKYQFQANKPYRVEIELPANNGNIYTCLDNLVFDPKSHSCSLATDTLTKDYSFKKGIFTPAKSGDLKGDEFTGQQYVIVPKAAIVTVKVTPL